MYTAHLDHNGIGNPVDGDSIYNGMYDNAMGSSLLIETARAFANSPAERSMVFIALTAEERGLLGSDYYAHYPTVPSDGIIANINLDMPLFLYPVADIIAFGSEHSSLEGTVGEAIVAEGFTLTPDPMPEEVIFIRSDQYSFVKQGVPSAFLVPGFTAADADIDGEKLWREFLRTHYHQPSDEVEESWDYDGLVEDAVLAFQLALTVANADQMPTWVPGDEFEAARIEALRMLEQ